MRLSITATPLATPGPEFVTWISKVSTSSGWRAPVPSRVFTASRIGPTTVVVTTLDAKDGVPVLL